MFKKIALLAGVILAIGTVFYLANRLGSPVLWVLGFVAVGTVLRYGSILLIGGSSERVISYFKRRSSVRIKLLNEMLTRTQITPNDLSTEEVAAFLIISMVREGIDIAHRRAAEFPNDVFHDEFFRYMVQVLQDMRTIGLSREFQLQLVGFGESLAKKYQFSEWASEFRTQRERIFKRHKESIPVIRASR